MLKELQTRVELMSAELFEEAAMLFAELLLETYREQRGQEEHGENEEEGK